MLDDSINNMPCLFFSTVEGKFHKSSFSLFLQDSHANLKHKLYDIIPFYFCVFNFILHVSSWQ